MATIERRNRTENGDSIISSDMSECAAEIKSQTNVVVEFPSDGIVTHAMGSHDSSSQTSPLVKRLPLTRITSDSSTIGSSFVQVSKPDDYSMDSSSWSKIASTSFVMQQSIEDTDGGSYSSSSDGSVSDNLLHSINTRRRNHGSTVQQPEIRVTRCARCERHIPPNAQICAWCNLCSTNDDPDDKMKHNKQHESCNDILGQNDLETIADIVPTFVRNINSFLLEYEAVGIIPWNERDFLNLVAPFVNALVTQRSPKLSLMYKATMSHESVFNAIRSDGFTQMAMEACKKFTNNVDVAFSLAARAATCQRRRHRHAGRRLTMSAGILYPILEEMGDSAYSNYCCWIVATLRFEGDGTCEDVVKAPRSGYATTWELGYPELAVPLVRFNSKFRHTDVVRQLYNGLLQILYSQFGSYQQADDRKPSAKDAKRPKKYNESPSDSKRAVVE